MLIWPRLDVLAVVERGTNIVNVQAALVHVDDGVNLESQARHYDRSETTDDCIAGMAMMMPVLSQAEWSIAVWLQRLIRFTSLAADLPKEGARHLISGGARLR